MSNVTKDLHDRVAGLNQVCENVKREDEVDVVLRILTLAPQRIRVELSAELRSLVKALVFKFESCLPKAEAGKLLLEEDSIEILKELRKRK